jgi:hypothetical protein
MAVHGLGRHAVVSGRPRAVIGVIVGSDTDTDTDTDSGTCGDVVTRGAQVGAGRRIPPNRRPDWDIPDADHGIIPIFRPG